MSCELLAGVGDEGSYDCQFPLCPNLEPQASQALLFQGVDPEPKEVVFGLFPPSLF
jgi:hypothetical protein